MRRHSIYIAIAAITMAAFTGCSEKEDDPSNPNTTVPDPEGTIMIDVRNANNGGNDFVGIGIDAADNFYNCGGYGWQFMSLGEMKGLGNIQTIPDANAAGWAATIGVRPGYGNMAMRNSYTAWEYVAFYVDRYISSAGIGGVIGAEVKYLHPFVNPKMTAITVNSSATELDREAGSSITVELNDISSYAVTVTPDNKFNAVFTGQKQLRITALQSNNELQAVAGTLTISSGNKFTKEIAIKQRGTAPYIGLTSADTLLFDGTANVNQQIAVMSNTTWTANSNAGWCTVNTSSGTGHGSVIFSTEFNSSNTVRFATISVSATGAESKSVTVRQERPYIVATSADTLIDGQANVNKSISVTSNTTWTANSNVSWCTINTPSGTGNGTIIFSTEANNSGAVRTATITVSGTGAESKSVTIKQERPYIALSSTDTDLDGQTNTNKIITVTSNATWTANSNVSWCTINTSSGTGNGTVTFSTDVNNSGTTRSAIITVSGIGAESKSIEIKQRTWFAGGEGTVNFPYLIKTAEQLDLMRYHAGGKYFRMENNIDLTSFLSDSDKGWQPIAIYSTTIFDGGGFTISGLWINRPDEIVGLFLQAQGNTNSIYALNLQLSAQGIIGGQYTGGIIGAGAYIYNCSVTGNITGGEYTGGIAGNGGYISNCSVNGAIKGITYVGGIVGYGSNITKCYSTGSVEGTVYTGGLAGVGDAIEDSYSTSNVTTKGGSYVCYAGGLIGYSYGTTIKYSYYAGQITVDYTAGGSALMGGLCGTGNATITSSYYDMDVVGSSVPYSTGAKTTSEMKQQATFYGWDFYNVWQIVEGVSYPTLRPE